VSLLEKPHTLPEALFTITFLPSTDIKNLFTPFCHKPQLISNMATTVSYTPSANSRFVKTGLGGAGNYYLVDDLKSSKYANVSYDAVSISTTTSLLKDDPDWDTFSTAPTISPATKGLEKLKARIQSHVTARNSRVSLYEAWQRKLPTYYATQAYPTENVYPPHKAHVTYLTQDHSSEKSIQRQKDYPAYKTASLSGTRSGAEIVASKVGNVKGRVAWRLARISDFGVEEGMRTEYPAYSKVEH
jgi:hypothetical protein